MVYKNTHKWNESQINYVKKFPRERRPAIRNQSYRREIRSVGTFDHGQSEEAIRAKPLRGMFVVSSREASPPTLSTRSVSNSTRFIVSVLETFLCI